MATKDKQTPERVDIVGLIVFAVVVAVFLLVGPKAGTRAFGAWMVIATVIQEIKARTAKGRNGRQPVTETAGGLATALRGLLIAIGLGMLVWPEVAMDLAGMGAA